MTTGYRLAGSTGLHKGDRDYQQDQVLLLPHAHTHGCILGVVADGMGGRTGGRKAADQVMLTARQLFERYAPDRDDPQAFLQQLVEEAHLVIRLVAIASEEEPHSTIAAFLVGPQGHCHWVHVGDSRLYHFRQGALAFRTHDHSYVQALVDRGEITEQQAQVHPQSNILLGCLGTETDPPIGQHTITQLVPGDILVGCSDGAWHYLPPHEIHQACAQADPRDAVQTLIQIARMRAGGKGDNLSVIVVKVEALVPPVEAPAPAPAPRLPARPPPFKPSR